MSVNNCEILQSGVASARLIPHKLVFFFLVFDTIYVFASLCEKGLAFYPMNHLNDKNV